jgi:hypothetical protein
MSSTGNAIHGNILTAGIMSSTGNAIHGNILTAGLISATGNATAGNVVTAGVMSSTGNAIHGNILTAGVISATGNVYTGNLIVSGSITDATQLDIQTTASNANIVLTPNGTGNVNTPANVSVTGNIQGNYVLGNGSQLTGISSSSNTISNGNSNVSISTANGNITVGVTGTSNVVVWSSAGQYVTGIVSASGNIYSNGNVALGLATANARLHVSGNIYATGDIVSSYSDERLKTRLGNIDRAVEKVLAIDTFYYEPNHTAITLGAEPGRQVGVSAQSVQQVQQETVTTSPLSSDYLTVKYDRLVPLLIAAVKEQQQAIEQLRSEISLLKKD